MPVKVLDKNGDGFNSQVAEGIDYVVNFRQGGVESGPRHQPEPRRLVAHAGAARRRSTARWRPGSPWWPRPVTTTSEPWTYPAAFDSVIAVGAIDGRKEKAPIRVSARPSISWLPAGDLRRDDNADGRPDGVLQQTFDPATAALGRYDNFAYYFVVGTSQAAPQVSAVAALLARQGIKDPKAIKAIMERTAEDLGAAGRDDRFGWGLIRPAEALKGLGLSK